MPTTEDNGRGYTAGPYRAHCAGVFAGEHCIAVCGTDVKPLAEEYANTRLFAASWALLTAAETLVARFEKQLTASGKYVPRNILAEHEIAIIAARAAIAKAVSP